MGESAGSIGRISPTVYHIKHDIPDGGIANREFHLLTGYRQFNVCLRIRADRRTRGLIAVVLAKLDPVIEAERAPGRGVSVGSPYFHIFDVPVIIRPASLPGP